MGAVARLFDVAVVVVIVTISIVMDFTGYVLHTGVVYCVLCICNEWQKRPSARARTLTLFLAIAHFLFTRLTNVGVFVELVASAIDTAGDADDDRIYSTKQNKKSRNKM